MANIKGLTVEIGGDTTKLGKALEGVNKQSRDLSSELGQINKLLKMDPGNADLLAQKQKVLAEAISTTREKLDTLKEAEKQVQAQFERGEVSEDQVRALQREIIATEKKLQTYERAAKETADEVEDLGDKSKDTSKDVDRLGDESKDTSKDVDDLGDESKDTSKDVDDLADSSEGLGTALGVVVGLVGAAIGGLTAITEETREYRREMGKLETAYESAGHSNEAATKTYQALQGVLGETDQAVEAANHLANLADNEVDLQKWTKILTGTYAKFGTSLPVEGLAEAAAEVAKTGKLTGGLTDAINWGADATETFGVKMKDATKENEEFNKKVAEATNAEEFFQIALDECSTEQERQQLITETLTKLYGDAADKYRETNAEVIRANEVNEKWAATMAGIGADMEPVLTDIKEFGTSLLEDMREPLKDVIGWIRDKFLPAVKAGIGWIVENKGPILAALGAVTAGYVAYKVAVMAATAKQTILNAVMWVQNANPFALLLGALTAITAAIVIHTEMTEKDIYATADLTERQKELLHGLEDATEAIKEQDEAFAESAGKIQEQAAHHQALVDELGRYVDASGNVAEADRARVDFILGELNNAYGTEYQMVDGQIQQYEDLKNKIYEVINAKTANALLEAKNEEYIAAIEKEREALERVVAAEAAVVDQKPKVKAAEDAYLAFKEQYYQRLESGYYAFHQGAQQADERTLIAMQNNWGREQSLLSDREAALDEASGVYADYTYDIETYEAAQTAILQGNYDQAIELLRNKGAAHLDYAATVDESTRQAVDALYLEAIEAGVAAEKTRANFEAGVEGYTAEMVKEAEDGYAAAMAEFEGAWTEANSIGGDISAGLESGMEGKLPGLISSAKNIIANIWSAMRAEADSHSPSRKTRQLGRDLDAGLELGMKDGNDDVLSTARRQVESLINVYSGEDHTGAAVQDSLRAAASKSYTESIQAADTNAARLDAILAAIERGQVLTIDGDALVGATATYMDNALGRRRALASRGAI